MLTGEQSPDDGELTVGKSVKMVRFGSICIHMYFIYIEIRRRCCVC